MENSENITTNPTIIEPALSFTVQGQETPALQIFPNGDFHVHGRLVENDIEVFRAFKQWLIDSGMIVETSN